MGLDMYLDKSLYISKFDKQDAEVIPAVYDLLKVKDESNNYPHFEITMPAIYWRKANAIHAWFVDKVQNGVDECQTSDVDVEQLIELRKEIVAVLKTKNTKQLPPRGGFFFGSTDIDEYYWEDMKFTKEALDREIQFYESQKELGRYWNFSYRASW